jgi:hypothetical protein
MKANPELYNGNRMLQIAAGLQILANHGGRYDVAAEHDIIYAGCTAEISDEDAEGLDGEGPNPRDQRLSKEEQKKLEDLGWFIDSETTSWAFFT